MKGDIKLAIIGSRNFTSYDKLEKVIDSLFANMKISKIISGRADGADSLGVLYAKEHNIDFIEFLPDWDKYGKPAGLIRNTSIIEAANFVVAFWDGSSTGTADSLKKAKKRKIPTLIIYF